MKVIINYNIYDTETAEKIFSWRYNPYNNGNSWDYISNTIFRTKKGNYFKYSYRGDYEDNPTIEYLTELELLSIFKEVDITGQEEKIMKYFGEFMIEG